MKVRHIFLGKEKPNGWDEREKIIRRGVLTSQGRYAMKSLLREKMERHFIYKGRDGTYMILESFVDELEDLKSDDLKRCISFGEKIISYMSFRYIDKVVGVFSFGSLKDES